jgi:hypothetical protein
MNQSESLVLGIGHIDFTHTDGPPGGLFAAVRQAMQIAVAHRDPCNEKDEG